RFAEALGIAQERSGCKTNYYITNPSFDGNCASSFSCAPSSSNDHGCEGDSKPTLSTFPTRSRSAYYNNKRPY
ncbi:MAG: hypothetical protein IKB34_01400, partial [Clostridia bacterium]|nr:hypothetical protein [Clostridia bacterium]